MPTGENVGGIICAMTRKVLGEYFSDLGKRHKSLFHYSLSLLVELLYVLHSKKFGEKVHVKFVLNFVAKIL